MGEIRPPETKKLVSHVSLRFGNFRCDCVIQCPLDIATLDIATALSIATSTPVTEASRYIQCALY